MEQSISVVAVNAQRTRFPVSQSKISGAYRLVIVQSYDGRNTAFFGHSDDRRRQLVVDVMTMHDVGLCSIEQVLEFPDSLGRVDRGKRGCHAGCQRSVLIIPKMTKYLL